MSTNTTGKVNAAITFADIFFILRKNIILLLIITILFGVGGGIYGFKFTTPTYTATANVFIVKEKDSDVDYSHSLNMVESSASVFGYNSVAIKVSEALSEKFEETIDYKEVWGGIQTEIIQYNLNVVVKFTTTRSPEFAVAAVNQYIESVIDYVDNDLVAENKDTGEKFYPLKNKIISTAPAIEASKNDRSKTIFLLSIVIGFVLGLVTVFIKYLLNDTFTSREEFERQTGLSVLVVLPNPVFKGDNNAF